MNTTESMADHTWLKVGGPAEIVTPSTTDEIISIVDECHKNNRKYRILGNGSNVLVSDEGLDELVIKMTECCNELECDGTVITVGASVLLPQFINFCISNNLGGLEYLYSVPGTIGGAIHMNAGRGRTSGQSISDHLVSVKLYDGEELKTVSKDDLIFDHRYSTFQEHEDWVILGATFDLDSTPQTEARNRARERMKHVESRERSLPNAGSVFRAGLKLPMKGFQIGDAKFVHKNRICNMDDAKSKDIFRLIKITIILHRIVPFLEKPDLEWRVWK